MRILKFQLPVHGPTVIYTKGPMRILSVGADGQNIPSLWAEVDESVWHEDTFTNEFVVVFTGDDVPQNMLYVGTFGISNNEFILHVYKKIDLTDFLKKMSMV